METDYDLPTLIKQKDHLNVLRYIRLHQLREPKIVLTHGKALLGEDLSGAVRGDELATLAAVEQISLAALDLQEHPLAEKALKRLQILGVSKDSTRFRRLLARCLESADSLTAAELIYDDLLKENPANVMALKRKYCIYRSQVGKEVEAAAAMNTYLEQNYADTAAWYELAKLRMEMGDFKAASFCLEEVLLGAAADSKIHCELAECYATVGDLDNLLSARKHMAQSLELDPTNRRAQFGLVVVANAYLIENAKAGKRAHDSFEDEVAQELVYYGSEQVLKSYKGSTLFATVKALMSEYTAKENE